MSDGIHRRKLGQHRRRAPAVERGGAWSHHPSRATRRRMRAHHSRGAALYEAALVTPLFFMLIFGIMEIGLAMNDYLALSSSVRAGSRTASASGDNPFADYNTIQVTLREASALNDHAIDYIVVYKPGGFGEPPTTSCQDGVSSAGVCNVYRAADWNRPREAWGCSVPSSPDRHWCPATRKVTLADGGSDYVGVWMKIEHGWVTKMFGNAVTLTDSSVIRLEPRSKT